MNLPMLSSPTISCGSKSHKFIVYCVNYLSRINLTSYINCFLGFVLWVFQLVNLEISLCLPCPDFGRLSQYFPLQKAYCHFLKRLFLHALSLLNSYDRICHLTCDRSQAHWSVTPRTLFRAQEWQDMPTESPKPIATKQY